MSYAGVDTWLKLHSRMTAIIPGLNRKSEACKKKFNVLYKQSRLDKMANGISRSYRKEWKYYEAFDQWWHQIGTVKKHVTVSANESNSVQDIIKESEKRQSLDGNTNSSVKFGKKNFQEQTYGLFTQMVKNNSVIVKNFDKTNALLEKVEPQMDRLINKLWNL
jgi:hypothetical protein